MDAFLAPFVNDLTTLYVNGITVQIDAHSYTFHAALLAFLADNLAAHAVAGFKESFSFAKRICRTCMATVSSIQSLYNEEQCELHTCVEHKMQCLDLWSDENPQHVSKEYGINRRSILENVPGFSVINGMPHDIMHDLSEDNGIETFLRHCIQSKLFCN